MEILPLELRKLGLKEKEVQVYLTGLELGPSSVQKIAKKAKITRPTTYEIIKTLEKKGLFIETKQKKKRLFVAQSPERILGILKIKKREIEEKEREFIRIIATLQSKYSEKLKIQQRKEEKMAVKTKPVGLYQMIGGAKNGDMTSQGILNAIKAEMPIEDRERLLAWAKEFRFWEEYAKIYYHIEDTGFYDELAETIRGFIEPEEEEVWLDAGCGPAKMSQLVWKKSEGKVKKIVGIDIVLNPAREALVKLGGSIPLELKYANLGERLPFPDDFFDGIVANISLTYVIDFQGKKGKAAFVEVMREMFRVLKPDSHIVWSTPKRNAFFWRNFLFQGDQVYIPEFDGCAFRLKGNRSGTQGRFCGIVLQSFQVVLTFLVLLFHQY